MTNHKFHRGEGKPRPWAVGAFSDHMAARCSAGQPARRNVRCIVQALTIGHTRRHRHRTQGWRNAQKNCHRCQDSRFPPASIVFAIPARILWSTACQWGLLPREKNEVQALLSPSKLFKVHHSKQCVHARFWSKYTFIFLIFSIEAKLTKLS